MTVRKKQEKKPKNISYVSGSEGKLKTDTEGHVETTV